MGAKRITVPQKETFWQCIREGCSVAVAAKTAGFSTASGERLVGNPGNGREYREVREAATAPELPIPLEEVCDAAQEALADPTGALFAKRYFGYDLSPFQRSVFQQCDEDYASPDRSFSCLNGPPGLGKTTSFVVFASRETAKDRAMRGMFISGAKPLAVKNTKQVRNVLSRVTPMIGAASTMARDFGRFKPRQGGEVWRIDEFSVLQWDGDLAEDKEATWTAFGFESMFIGNRIKLLFGDDLDGTRTIRNIVTVEGNREVFDNDLEPRLEPGGAFILGQQRLGAHDFSNHVLKKRIAPDDDDGEGAAPEGTPKYRHIVYKVHYEELCSGLPEEERRLLHRPDAPAYPDGCLLDPRRMSWRDVRTAMQNPETFELVYQQREADPAGVLVKKIWVAGGRDSDTGEDHPGCWDDDRGLCELPRGLTPPLLSVVTVDPSVANYWAFQWWVVHPESEQRFLMDCVRQRMSAESLLDWLYDESRWHGIMEDWQRRSEQVSLALHMNVRISTWVLEAVAAFKFLTAFDHSKRWRRQNGVTFIAHETHINKRDANLGVSAVGPHWKYGRVRLPGRGAGRLASLKLVDEVTRYRIDGAVNGTDDQVDANWMLEWNMAGLLNTLPRAPTKLARPGFVKSSFGRPLTAVK